VAEDPLERYAEAVLRALRDPDLQEALHTYVPESEERVRRFLESRPDIAQLAREVRAIKEYSIAHLDELIDQAMSSFKAVGATPHYASDAAEAREIVGKLVGTGKVIVMSKSMTAQVNYSINGEGKTLTIPVTFYTTSILAWS